MPKNNNFKMQEELQAIILKICIYKRIFLLENYIFAPEGADF